MEAKEVRSLQEAYASIYEEDERSPEANAAKQEAAKKAHQDKKKQTPITAGGGAPEEDGQVDRYRRMGIDRQQQREMRGQRERSQWKTKSESADLFDIVKGHLMSEGYADTEEAALAIMANMSEEWRQSIVEMGLTPDQESRRRDLSKAINKAGTPGYPGVNDPATRKMQGEYIQLQKLKEV